MHDLLSGIRVVDLTTIVLGPYATQVLGDMGADVIKIEPLTGDLFRTVRPGRDQDMGAGFLNCNRNKRSVALDLTRKEGREALHAILKTADVLMHNMRPSSAARIGASYAEAKAVRPDIVYCYAPGFGQDGPYAAAPAYDDTIQAASGLAALNADSEGAPRFLPNIIGDKVGGLHLALAALMGVIGRMRTGRGCCIEAPMFESVVSFLMLEQLSGHTFRPPIGGVGYERLQSPNRRPHRTKDGYIAVLPYNTEHWTCFLELIGRADMARLDLVRDPVVRSRNIDKLYKVVAEAMPARTTGEWLSVLNAADIPCSRVNSFADLLEEEHLKAVEMFEDIDHPTEGATRVLRSPFNVIGRARELDAPAPRLGEDTRVVLEEAGFSEGEISLLIESGAAQAAASKGAKHGAR
ncbi:MAG: CoA transferase [Hyphomonadaceae bacterium]|nr:CoA transferase [Hyphomonadaceae bacterium]